jgi:cell fate regulator YaaT (PSP1 superfamily)
LQHHGDARQNIENKKQEKEAFKTCEKKIKEHGLDMKLMDVEFKFDKSKILFFFTADGRIDFRELVRDLASVYKTRIELRQIGVRDKAKEIGGYGQCGRKLCCHGFLDNLNGVSINMAKNQNLALNPEKINGVCGRLMCCLAYENESYFEYKKDLPRVGEVIKTKEGTGKVIYVDLFAKKYKIETEEGQIIDIEK